MIENLRITCIEAQDENGESFDPPRLAVGTVLTATVEDEGGVTLAWVSVDITESNCRDDWEAVADLALSERGWRIRYAGPEWRPSTDGAVTTGIADRLDAR